MIQGVRSKMANGQLVRFQELVVVGDKRRCYNNYQCLLCGEIFGVYKALKDHKYHSHAYD